VSRPVTPMRELVAGHVGIGDYEMGASAAAGGVQDPRED
jgi:hypothetical protein